MMLTQTSPNFGDQIGRYRLLAELARGGMGIVYVAAAQGPAGFQKVVALKELQPELVRDSEFLTMFLEEARIAARLNHPNIVQTIDVSESDGRHFIAMEYLEGRSLYQVLRRFAPKGGFPLHLSLSVIRDALNALDYAHELADSDGRRLGFVHRDMSPHNIFVTFDGHSKVIDFGIAKARDSAVETKTGVLKGRTHYMAPEQLTHQADRRTDIFAVGAILFEIVAGRRLWKGLGEIEILGRLLRGDIPSLETVRTVIPGPIFDICKKALSASPADRYATAAEMRDALDEYLWQSGGIPRPKEIAEALVAEFGPERQKHREIIDRALSRLGEGQKGRLEALAIAQEPSTRSPMPSAIARVPTGVYAAQPEAPPPNLTQPILDRVLAFARGHRLVVGSAVVLVLMAITAAIVLSHDRPPPVSSVAVVAPAPPTPAPAPAPRPAAAPVVAAAAAAPTQKMIDTIELSIAVSPSHAQVLIDGEVMPSNPFLGRFPRSTAMHRIRAVAPGFEPRERLVSFADNVLLDLSLTPKPTPATKHEPPVVRVETTPPPSRRSESRARVNHPPPPPPPRPATPPAPVAAPPPPPPPRSTAPADISPRPEGPRRRSIDATNPYGDDK
jgi:serine/threonine-protein kinase